MKVVRIEFKSAGFKEILESGEVRGLVESTTEQIAARANANNTRGGEGFRSGVFLGGAAGRWIGSVKTTDRESRIAEAEDKALSRSI